MALSADDRLLGEKTHYYCSSSEDEDDKTKESGNDDARSKKSGSSRPKFIPEAEAKPFSGCSANTGPKGVIEDWRKFKQLETEKREDQEVQRLELAKKLSLTCRTTADDEKEKTKDAAFAQAIEDDFDKLEEVFLKEYQQKRLEELRKSMTVSRQFGSVLELEKSMFLDAIDKEERGVAVIIHIYEKGLAACDTMNRCLDTLATEYPSAKFCRIKALEVKLSLNFAISGVPALLVYRNGELIGNFVRLGEEFGDDFYSTDVESFLVEHGILHEELMIMSTVRSSSSATAGSLKNDSDSD